MLLQTLKAQHNAGREILFETVYGSKLYGCDLPGSDHDIRGVYAPGLYDFLRSGNQEPASLIPDGDLGVTDDNLYYPDAMFIDQVMGMKNNCVEVFFAARQAQRNGATLHPMMRFIVDQKDSLVVANAAGFMGHARQRCGPYITGEDPKDVTLMANKFALATVDAVIASNPEAGAWKLGEVDGLVETLCSHERIHLGPNNAGVTVLFIHTRQSDLTIRLAELARTIRSRLERFTKTDEGISEKQKFKDLSTALRMMETVGVLMETGEITFPIPTAQRHREIRLGHYSVEQILEWIDATQTAVEYWEKNGPLRKPMMKSEEADLKLQLVAELRYMRLKTLDLTV